MCSIELQLFRSALGMGKIMRDWAQMCGSKIIPAFDLKGFMLVLGNIIIIRPCQLRYMYMVSKIIPAFDLKASLGGHVSRSDYR